MSKLRNIKYFSAENERQEKINQLLNDFNMEYKPYWKKAEVFLVNDREVAVFTSNKGIRITDGKNILPLITGTVDVVDIIDLIQDPFIMPIIDLINKGKGLEKSLNSIIKCGVNLKDKRERFESYKNYLTILSLNYWNEKLYEERD